MKKMRVKIKAYTEPRNKLYLDMKELVKGLNRILQDKNYYKISPIAFKWLNQIDWYVLERLTLFNNKKRNIRRKHGNLKIVQAEINHLIVKLARNYP